MTGFPPRSLDRAIPHNEHGPMGKEMKMATLYMETTRIKPERTISEIEKILSSYGAKQILKEYDNGEIQSLKFLYSNGNIDIP